jgi:hypothetical protein
MLAANRSARAADAVASSMAALECSINAGICCSNSSNA